MKVNRTNVNLQDIRKRIIALEGKVDVTIGHHAAAAVGAIDAGHLDRAYYHAWEAWWELTHQES